MNGMRAFGWFGAATLATLALLHPGYDASEGSDHVRVALHWLETGRMGQADRPAGIFLQGQDGLYYPVHELGNIFWVMPAAAAGLALESTVGPQLLNGSDVRVAELAASFLPVLLVTATALGFWKWLEWGFDTPLRTRMSASALLVFATMLLPYSRSLADVVATGCWLTWGAAFAARAAATGRIASAAAAGVCLGFAFLTRVPAAVAILPIFIWMVARAPAASRWQLAAVAVAAGLPSLAGVLWFNELRMGSPFLPAEMHPQNAIVQPGGIPLHVGVAGLLISPGKSIFLFSPVLLLAAAAMPRMLRAARSQAWLVLAVLILFLAAHGSVPVWHGDWGWGPRYAVFILPILWLPAIFVLDPDRAGRGSRHAIAAIVAASLAVQATAVIINWQYRYQLIHIDGRLDPQTPWRLDNQLTDGLRGAAGNLARMAGADVPVRDVPGVSPQTLIASTGVNVWWVTALRLGLPPAPVLGAAGALAAFAWLAWGRARRSVRG